MKLEDWVQGFVLTGGASKRFGRDKALAVQAGLPLLSHSVGVLTDLGLPARAVCPDPEPYLDLVSIFVTDERPGMGPVEGLRALLRACTAPFALVLATDMPGVDADMLRDLVRASLADPSLEALCFSDSSARHPFPGVYAVTILDRIAELESMQAVLDTVKSKTVTGGGIGLHNVNRPEDLGEF